MKFNVGDRLKFYKMTPIGWIHFTHYCNDPNKECMKEENIRKDLMDEMYEEELEVTKVSLFSIQVEQVDEWCCRYHKWYSKRAVSKVLKYNKDKETFYQLLREDIDHNRKKKHI